jgi:hypothetical protein
MSLNPSSLNGGSFEPGPVETGVEPPSVPRKRHSRLLNICFAIFAFEIGIFLAIYPWLDDRWKINYFHVAFPALANVWEDPYFRGALTGLGLVNIYVGLWEFFRTLRRG